MKYIEIKNIKIIEKVKEEIDKVLPISPKLYLNRDTLAFVLEINETLVVWEKLHEIIISITKDAIIKNEMRLDDSRNLIPLSKTLEVISHKDITEWKPENLIK